MIASISRAVSLWTTPSYAVRLAEVAAELAIDPRSVGVAKGYFSGEAGLQVPCYRERIEQLWAMQARDMYGTAELGMHSGECEHLNGLHFGATGFVVLELIDPDSGAVLPFEDGQTGEVVYTSIHREACPLQRMRSHDLIQVFTEPCGCGRTTFRFRVLGRSDDMFIVKGVNVFPLAIQASLNALQPRVTGEFQVVLDREPPIDYAVPIAVEVSRDVPRRDHEKLAREIESRLATDHNFASAVRLVPQGSIASDRKTQRVVRAYRGEDAR
jgi:phenylacetate-CoA ligase